MKQRSKEKSRKIPDFYRGAEHQNQKNEGMSK